MSRNKGPGWCQKELYYLGGNTGYCDARAYGRNLNDLIWACPAHGGPQGGQADRNDKLEAALRNCMLAASKAHHYEAQKYKDDLPLEILRYCGEVGVIPKFTRDEYLDISKTVKT